MPRNNQMIIFKLLGAALVLYIAYALARGEVYAKRGPWGAASRRSEQPVHYWSAIAAYTILSAALLFYF